MLLKLMFIVLLPMSVFASDFMTYQEIAQKMRSERKQITSAHIVRVVEKFDKRPTDVNEPPRALAKRNCTYREEIWVDVVGQVSRVESQALGDENDVDTTITKDGFELTSLAGNTYVFDKLNYRPDAFNAPYLGIFEFMETDVSSDVTGGQFRKLTIARPNRGNSIIAILDPEFGYHCRKLEEVAGKVTKVNLFDDYRTIEGKSYPYQCANQAIDANGTIFKGENIYTETVEFNVDLKDVDIVPSAQTDVKILDFKTNRVIEIKKGSPLWPN